MMGMMGINDWEWWDGVSEGKFKHPDVDDDDDGDDINEDGDDDFVDVVGDDDGDDCGGVDVVAGDGEVLMIMMMIMTRLWCQ